MILEQAVEPFARAAAVAGEDDFSPAFPKLGDVFGDGFVDVGLLRAFGGEVAGRFDFER